MNINNIRLFFLKEYSFSVWMMVKFIALFILKFLFFFIPFYVGIIISSSNPNYWLNKQQWQISIIGALLLVVINYFWEQSRDKSKNRMIESDKIIYDCIGGAIQELHELRKQKNGNDEHYINEILIYIEKVVIVILKSIGTECGTLCVNYMKKEGDFLKLTNFATKFQDRDKPKIKFDINDPLPGAPEAWVLKKVIYINDVENKKFKPYFKESYKFRSFISIPVHYNQQVYGIINIDSNLKDQFISDDFISKKIMTKISPLLSLFIFKIELFK